MLTSVMVWDHDSRGTDENPDVKLVYDMSLRHFYYNVATKQKKQYNLHSEEKHQKMKKNNVIFWSTVFFLSLIFVSSTFAQEIEEGNLKCIMVDTTSYESTCIITFQDSLGEYKFFYMSDTDYYKYCDLLGLKFLKDSVIVAVTYIQMCFPKKLRLKIFRDYPMQVVLDDLLVYDPKKGFMVNLYFPLNIKKVDP